jgi:enoyl-CoA hydratase/carnithine racemase
MGLAVDTKSFECTIEAGLAHIVLNQPDRGNPIDGDFCHEFNLCMAELSERDDVRAVLISARGRLFSVGGDLGALASQAPHCPLPSSRGLPNCMPPSCEWSVCERRSSWRCKAMSRAAAYR